MNTVKTLLFVAIASMAFMGCQNKESAINDLRDLKENVVAKSDNYSVDDWKKFLTEFHKTDSIINTYELTSDELDEVKKIKSQCAKYIFKANTKVAASELKGLFNDVVDSVSNALGGNDSAVDDAEDAAKEVMDNVNDAINSASKAAKGAMDEAKEAIGNASDALKGMVEGMSKDK